jgi:phosphonate transport system substrate-binding protein
MDESDPLHQPAQPTPLNNPIPEHLGNVQNQAPAPAPAPRRSKPLIAAALVIFALLIVGGAYAAMHKKTNKPASQTNSNSVLRVGTTIDEDGLVANTQEYTPFINYMATQLHSQGIIKAEFVPQTSVSAVVKSINQGKTDVYIDSVFPVFVADRLSGSKLLADRWKEGVEKYHTAIFVKQNSPIKTVADLNGKIIAMDSNTSTVGYFLPKAELLKAGYKLNEKQQASDSVSNSEIGYQFVHGKVFDSVANGVLPAGAESEQEIRDHFGASFDQDYRIIMTSPNVLRFAVTTRPGMQPALRAAIKNTLLNMDQSDNGKFVLQKFSDTAKFTDVGNDTDAAFGEIQKLTDYVEQEIISSGAGGNNQQ